MVLVGMLMVRGQRLSVLVVWRKRLDVGPVRLRWGRGPRTTHRGHRVLPAQAFPGSLDRGLGWGRRGWYPRHDVRGRCTEDIPALSTGARRRSPVTHRQWSRLHDGLPRQMHARAVDDGLGVAGRGRRRRRSHGRRLLTQLSQFSGQTIDLDCVSSGSELRVMDTYDGLLFVFELGVHLGRRQRSWMPQRTRTVDATVLIGSRVDDVGGVGRRHGSHQGRRMQGRLAGRGVTGLLRRSTRGRDRSGLGR